MDNKMVEYILITSTSVQELVISINTQSKEGWIPQGGISTRTLNKYECELIQAMVRVVDNE